MTSPQIQLAPWEIEPERHAQKDGPPFSFRAIWLGEERDFVGQIICHNRNLFYWWFRLPSEPELGNFLCTMVGNATHPPCSPEWDWNTHPRPQDFAARVEAKRWGRLFVLDADFQLADGKNSSSTIFLAASGWGRVNIHRFGTAHFQWASPCPESLARPDFVHCLHDILVHAHTPHDPVQFAFHWASLRKERINLALPVACGDYERWNRMVQLYATVVLCHKEGWVSHLAIRLVWSELDIEVTAEMTRNTKIGFRMEKGDVDRLQPFLIWSREYYRPFCNRKLYDEHPCVRSFVDSKPRLLDGFIECPTQHECLEALLQLREWFADKATPAEIEELFRQD